MVMDVIEEKGNHNKKGGNINYRRGCTYSDFLSNH